MAEAVGAILVIRSSDAERRVPGVGLSAWGGVAHGGGVRFFYGRSGDAERRVPGAGLGAFRGVAHGGGGDFLRVFERRGASRTGSGVGALFAGWLAGWTGIFRGRSGDAERRVTDGDCGRGWWAGSATRWADQRAGRATGRLIRRR